MTSHTLSAQSLLARGPVIPVIVLKRLAHAVPLARALVEGGVVVLEITLRTEVGLEAIGAIADAVPEAIVGAGTVMTAADVKAVATRGARFVVSPGISPSLLEATAAAGLPYLPGGMTPSDVLMASAAGLSAMKFFPAREAGGPAMLRALSGPFAAMRFCATGGIDALTAPDYLALPNVACVGGSWLAPAERMAAGDWTGITTLARAAATLPRHPDLLSSLAP